MQDDPEVVAALVAGEPRGLRAAYEAYADRLYAFCRGLLQRPGEAADAVHDTFVLASKWAERLRDPEMLRCWLYALARAECLRVLRGRTRRLPAVEPDHVTAPDPKTGLDAAQVQELVWSAAEGLDLTGWDVFELSVRHELTPLEVGEVLGIAPDQAEARLAPVRSQLERALGVLLVARTGREACPELARRLRGWDGWRLAGRARRRVIRHIESCEACQARERQLLSPTSLFAAYANAPYPAVPSELWPRLQATSFAPSFASARAAILARGTELEPDTGFPRLPDGRPRVPRAVAVAAMALVAVLAAVAGNLLTPDGVPSAPPAGQAHPEPAVAPDSPSPPGGTPTPASPTPPAPTGSPAGAPEPASSPTTSPPAAAPFAEPQPAPQPDGPLAVEAAAEPICADNGSYQLSATLTASRPLAAATLIVKTGGSTVDYPMTVNGSTASAVTGSLTANNLRWRVRVTDLGQETASTQSVKINRICRN